MRTRRHLLATVGLAATGAGCMGALGGGDEPSDDGDDPDPDDAGDTPEPTATEEPTEEPSRKTVLLERLSVRNQHDDDHRVQIAVEADGEVLHLGTYDLEKDSEARRIEGDWTQRDAVYRIHARLDDGSVRTTNVTEGVGESVDCVHVQVQVDDEGELAIWYGGHCA